MLIATVISILYRRLRRPALTLILNGPSVCYRPTLICLGGKFSFYDGLKQRLSHLFGQSNI
ncbi:conserved hypothetical protein [Xenorhabdus nematophila F1]|uniref:Uncharacterized protein n=1 Tax=Xenorhabdus nematophila (strain ATCC 19061 / DSM 3370 / CCUG 14189 / LMG 1036 / NCIMB 9965 / AN6) TaxID=406817 RepID=D3VG52_XENNA|nr:hypothetical protein D3790_15325 [Xenorhabdus nematophila]CBJ88142.1 hypothetical protein XNC1_0054 [Xenorhabdus nematophila ATCC 19061]CCW30316.1 conserved hypothetical protein [Xenorhabdus nematophila F1]CEE91871.1 hypothetical protein XNA1_2450005 [Xenorhabdus nematophila str. Anatoliense]CEK21058.1 hypothetical protein XNC2_0054 [Xenorhabdus nematophila AN6/1]